MRSYNQINRGHKPHRPWGPSYPKGPSSLNHPYIEYVLALPLPDYTLYLEVAFSGQCRSNPLSYQGAKYTSVKTTWNPLTLGCILPLQVRLNSYIPCILKKMKCKYFLQSTPYQHPPLASKWGHRRALSIINNFYFLPKSASIHSVILAVLLLQEKVMFEN